MTVLITVNGGLTAPPEIRYSNGGIPIATGTVASTERYLDKQSNEWRDGKSLYLRWTAFRELADNIAASQLDKGAQVSVTGKLMTRSFEDRDGQKRSVTELDVTDFAVSLRRATAQVTRSGNTSVPPRTEHPASRNDQWSSSAGWDIPPDDNQPF